jgi:hypothetical protein
VICNGEEVLTLGGTQAEYNVDIWSGNHPFYQVRARSRQLHCLGGADESATRQRRGRSQTHMQQPVVGVVRKEGELRARWLR